MKARLNGTCEMIKNQKAYILEPTVKLHVTEAALEVCRTLVSHLVQKTMTVIMHSDRSESSAVTYSDVAFADAACC